MLFLSSQLDAKCIIKDTNWISSSTSCKNGFLTGKATAFHHNGKLKFEGTFKEGVMIKGTVFYKDDPYYIGSIVDNEMHGEGICYFRNKPEKCEYYKGDRIDTIYKLRFLMRQQLLAIQGMMNEQAALYSQQINTQQPQQGTDIGSQIGGKVLQKATEKMVDSILDQFF